MALISSGIKIYNPSDYAELDVNKKEILRYSGVKMSEADFDSSYMELLDGCIDEAVGQMTYKVSWRRDSITWTGDVPNLPFDLCGSKALAKNLKGCSEVVMFAATVGMGIDRLIARYGRVSQPKALFMQAIGAERIEALCDLFNGEMKSLLKCEGKATRPRFSPGYGDLPLTVQREFIALLDCTRRIGISLNESCLMSPSKSVTAVFGIYDSQEENSEAQKCARCSNTECAYRSEV